MPSSKVSPTVNSIASIHSSFAGGVGVSPPHSIVNCHVSISDVCSHEAEPSEVNAKYKTPDSALKVVPSNSKRYPSGFALLESQSNVPVSSAPSYKRMKSQLSSMLPAVNVMVSGSAVVDVNVQPQFSLEP